MTAVPDALWGALLYWLGFLSCALLARGTPSRDDGTNTNTREW